MAEEQIIPMTGCNNCGGRCLLYAHVRDGRVVRMSTEKQSDCPGQIPLTACARGLHYHETFLGEDRLLYPMRRIGARGEGRFARISWAEAVEEIASQWIRIRDSYGPGSRYVNYSTGVSAAFSPDALAERLLSLDGGYLDHYNNYSNACLVHATRLLYGTTFTGSSPETWLESKLILLWGHNPAETRFDSQTMYYLRKAREKGIPLVVIDPRRSDTVTALGAEWLPLRPGTDSALQDAMAYTIWQEGLADRAFLDRCCLGFDEKHLPPEAPAGGSVLSYLLGESDGVAKTPAWAETITGIPAETIRALALRYATAKPAAIIEGYGAQRHAYGEQSARGTILLSCLCGNVGVPGGWAGGVAYLRRHREPAMPKLPNPYPMRIPVFRWTDAVERGRSLTARQGVVGGERLEADIKMILNLAGNTLINQHSDINRTAALLRDESKCEFIVCSDLFMTSSAKFADILLPGVSVFESENLTTPWHWGDFLGFSNKVIEPLGEAREEYEWLSEVAERLGLKDMFTEGRSRSQWLEHLYRETRRAEPELPPYEDFKHAGVFRYRSLPPLVAFERECADPERYPFPTPSGRIELYSPTAAAAPVEDPFPAIPRYVAGPEGVEDPLRERFPLQLIGWHSKRRCHSIHDNNPSLAALEPQRLWMHPRDATARGIADGDVVQVWNERGRLRVPVRVTERICPGVTALPQGAWYAPLEDGTDAAGSLNVLTSWHPTPYARGNPQHSNLVEVAPA